MDKTQLMQAFNQFVEGLEKGKKEEGRTFRIMHLKPNDPNAALGHDQYRYSFTTSKNDDCCLNLLIDKNLSDVEFLKKQIDIIQQLINKIESE